ncbi:hypothetical protein LCGC14_0995680 [marine sediment metagenome]|uniref:CcmD family protein n=1 Tax=marine sediment metagenome TaxID=412755 RepID=A0A0F9QMY8_9ZZZZ|nr:MAG: hypothetical protein Lokiarch_29780 [Candidatus Lokiarchaeum sp. GC14_75]
MSVQYEIYRDVVTITISYLLFWIVIIVLILYPKLKLKKIQKRIQNLEKNIN